MMKTTRIIVAKKPSKLIEVRPIKKEVKTYGKK